jgi:hypothetical protein
VSLATNPLYCNWAREPLNELAVTLKDPGYVDVMLNNLRTFLTKVNDQSPDARYIDKLFISNVVSPDSKFSIFLLLDLFSQFQ